EELGPGNSGGSKLFVDPRLKDDTGGVEMAAGSLQLAVKSRQRRPRIAADEHSSVKTMLVIEPALLERQPDERLDTAQQDGARICGVLVLERHRRVTESSSGHGGASPRSGAAPRRARAMTSRWISLVPS